MTVIKFPFVQPCDQKWIDAMNDKLSSLGVIAPNAVLAEANRRNQEAFERRKSMEKKID